MSGQQPGSNIKCSLRTLVYHRVAPRVAGTDDLAPALVSATPDRFARHLRHLTHTYVPVDADEVLAAIQSGHRLPRGAVLVTFDDGYRDFAEIAWPLLKQYRVPCVLFVCTGYASDPTQVFWWDALWQMLSRTQRGGLVLAPFGRLPLGSSADRMRTYRVVSERLKSIGVLARQRMWSGLVEQLGVQPGLTAGPAVLSWPELRCLADDGLCVAPHGRCHELLDQVDDTTLTREVQGAREDVVQQLGKCSPFFAYPNGNFDRRAIRALQAAHYAAGFTTIGGIDTIPSDQPLLLRRDLAGVSLWRLALKLSGPVAQWRAGRRPIPTCV